MRNRIHIGSATIRGMLIGFVLLAAGNSGWAQDQIGIYFDENAGSDVFFTATQDEIVSLYVTIVEPSAESGVESYVGTLSFVGEAGWGVSYYNDYWLGWLPFPTLWVSCDPPATGDSHIVIAQYNVLVESPSSRVDIYLSGFGATYRPPGETIEIQLSPISGDYSIPLVTINGAVSNDVKSWGEIKALFR